MRPACSRCAVDPDDVVFTAVRAAGAGGQNVNKVSNAAHLRFDIRASSLPPEVRERLLALQDARISSDGVVIIKAQAHRSLPMNRAEALARLQALVDRAAQPPARRIATQPTRAARQRRLADKSRHAELKARRGRLHGREA